MANERKSWFEVQDFKYKQWRSIKHFLFIRETQTDKRHEAFIEAKYHALTHNVPTRVLRCTLLYDIKPLDTQNATVSVE